MGRKKIVLFIGVAVVQLTAACAGNQAAKKAVSVLKKVQAATQVGVNYQQYNQLVIEARAAVNEASSQLSEGELKQELQAAVEAYADAGEGWSKCELSGQTILGRMEMLPLRNTMTGDATGLRLRKKYNIKTVTEDLYDRSIPESGEGMFSIDSLDQKRMLNTIWTEAEKRLNRASELAR